MLGCSCSGTHTLAYAYLLPVSVTGNTGIGQIQFHFASVGSEISCVYMPLLVLPGLMTGDTALGLKCSNPQVLAQGLEGLLLLFPCVADRRHCIRL